MEKWKPVIGYEGRYVVSDLGNVKSLITIDSRGQRRTPKLLSKSVWMKNGKPMREFVTLMGKDRSRKTCKVHALVMNAFCFEKPVGCEICHNNGNPLDNRISNLRYDTHRSNEKDKILHGRHLRGEKNHNAKLTKEQAIEIKNTDTNKYGELIKLANKFNVSSVTVSHIKHNRQWAWL